MRKKRFFLIGTITVLLIFGTTAISSIADEIEDAKIEKEEMEEKKAEIQNRVSELEEYKDDIVVYIEKLDEQLETLNEEINQLTEKIEVSNEELTETKRELKEAKKTEKIQYNTMKKRIKYMYENGSDEYLEILLESGSFGELLNRAEYIQKISEYDNQLLDNYKKAKVLVSDKEQRLEEQLEQLEAYNEEKTLEQEAVSLLVSKKQKELEKYEENISTAQQEIKEYVAAIEEQEKKIEELIEEERKRAEEERKQAEKNGEDYVEVTIEDTSYNSGFRWPLSVKGTITSLFGPRKSPKAGASSNHKGLDIAAPMGTPILAVASGKVVTATYQAAAGNYVMLYHGNDTYTIYMHASKLNVSKGDTVNQGDVIAYVGSTGVSTGPHLHFGVMINGRYVNPQNYISQ